MAAYRLTALEIVSLFSFSFEQVLDTMSPDEYEILNHAHPECLTAISIELLEVITEKLRALVAVFYLAFPQQSATFL